MPLIRLEPNPTPAEIAACWAKIDADPQRAQTLSDTGWQSAEDFLACAGATMVPCIAYMGHDPAALLWLTNLALLPPRMQPLSAHLGLYLLPPWQAVPISPPCAAVIQDGLRAYGFAHLWAFVPCGALAYMQALEACGFVCEATVPQWERYGGVWCASDIYHLRLERDEHV